MRGVLSARVVKPLALLLTSAEILSGLLFHTMISEITSRNEGPHMLETIRTTFWNLLQLRMTADTPDFSSPPIEVRTESRAR